MRPVLAITARFIPALLAALLIFVAPVHAVELQSVRVTETARLHHERPDWPIPADRNQLFYVQRSSNSNTVVYTARFDDKGQLDARNPIRVYWRRYNTTGEARALKPIESKFAYGVRTRPGDKPTEFSFTMVPAPNIPMLLRQTGPGKAEVLVRLGGRTTRLVYGFLQVDEGGLFPKVVSVSLHGIDIDTGRAINEVFSVSGGTIR